MGVPSGPEEVVVIERWPVYAGWSIHYRRFWNLLTWLL